MNTTEPFALSPGRERAFWALAEKLGLDLGASALTLARRVANSGSSDAIAVGAAAELLWHIKQGRPVEFRQRPVLAGGVTR